MKFEKDYLKVQNYSGVQKKPLMKSGKFLL